MTAVHLLHLAAGTSMKLYTQTDRVLFVIYLKNHDKYMNNRYLKSGMVLLKKGLMTLKFTKHENKCLI